MIFPSNSLKLALESEAADELAGQLERNHQARAPGQTSQTTCSLVLQEIAWTISMRIFLKQIAHLPEMLESIRMADLQRNYHDRCDYVGMRLANQMGKFP